MEYATLGASAPPATYQGEAAGIRTFDSIAEAAEWVRSANRRIQAMLDRFSPCPREAGGGQQITNARAPYTIALQELGGEIQSQVQLLDQLEKFI